MAPAPARPRRAAIALAALPWLAAALTLAGCSSFGPPRPEIPYQADVRIELVGGEPRPVEYLTEFYAYGLRRRQATVEGNDVVVIDRPDLRVSWVLDPVALTFEQHRMRSTEAAHPALPDPFGPRARAEFVEEGEDMLDGVRARRFVVRGEGIRGFAWISEDGVPLRFEGNLGVGERMRTVRIDYGEIQRGPQAAYLFTIPQNYAGFERRKKSFDAQRKDLEIRDAIQRLKDERRGRPTSPNGF